ncbi:conserved hypothetical protein [Coccidioides posadasii str. Silveira]|uniref:Uncharacterized protein n=1 Tax=Coccidioides posadasii (strain RMSCC 757 / Silveira) TaxID=443226 RepID=E9DGI4_COCPS|nr:conserved hypothetical protein [Coccidioides posadasii str. Silveira]
MTMEERGATSIPEFDIQPGVLKAMRIMLSFSLRAAMDYCLIGYLDTPYSQLRIPGLERRESFLEVPRSPEDEIMPVRGRKLCFPVDLSLLSARTRLSSGRLFANSQLQQAGVVQDLPDCQMQDFYHSAGFVHRPKVQLRPAP